jgi:hypothetical protein
MEDYFEIVDKLCSGHLAVRLKELYVPQEAGYGWEVNELGFLYPRTLFPVLSDKEFAELYAAAYTVQDLQKWIPLTLPGLESYHFVVEEKDGEWQIYYSDGRNVYEDLKLTDKTEADAYAGMLIYLLENRFINPEDLYS